MTEPEFDQNSSPRRRERKSWFRRAKRNPIFSFIWDVFAVVAGALVLSLLVKTFLIRSFYIPSGSMENTLMVNDRIIVNELEPSIIPVSRGDVVVFRDPGGWLGDTKPRQNNFFIDSWDWFLSVFGITAPDSDEHLVKRVIGIPGDHVVCCDAKGRLQINGKSIIEPYVAKDSSPSDMKFNVRVPKNSYWVMGDNRSNSADSRFHQSLPSKGFVNQSFIVGRAIFISYPFKRFGWIDNHQEVFKKIP